VPKVLYQVRNSATLVWKSIFIFLANEEFPPEVDKTPELLPYRRSFVAQLSGR